MRQWGNYPLESCIEDFSNRDCEDPRDKVYGLMGLVREEERFKVDYSKSAQQIYCELVMTYCTVYISVTNTVSRIPGSRRPQNDFSLASQKYVLSLMVLSQRMGLSKGETTALRPLLKDIWASGGLIDLGLRDVATSSPIAEMGFSPGHTPKSSRLPAERDTSTGHCWWLRATGRTHQYKCCLAEDACCTTPAGTALSP